jgi:phasin family protein
MLVTQEQIQAANKANLETLAQLSRKTFEGVEKLLDLNLQVAKTMMSETVDHLDDSAHATDIKEILAQQANFVQPMGEKALSYSRHIYNIMKQTQANLVEVSADDMKKRTEQIQKMMQQTWNADTPNASNALANMLKQAVANANTTFEASQKAIKQAIDMTNLQASTVTQSAIKASEQMFKAAVAN